MTRRTRSLAAVFAVFAWLFAQMAVAAYACPVVALAVSAAPAGEDCHRAPLDVEQPALCHAHCHFGAPALDKPALSLPDQAATATPIALVDSGWRRAAGVVAPGDQRSLLQRATAPPLAVRHCRFRI